MLELRAGDAVLGVAPEQGGRLIRLSVADLDLLVTAADDAHDFGCFPMAPWAGRLRDGAFVFGGVRHQLPRNKPPHAIHGIVRDRAWTVDEHETAAAVLSVALDDPWPFHGRVVQRFELTPDALSTTMEVHADDVPMPASCGWHPWWARAAGRGAALTLELHAEAMFVKDKDGIPNGEVGAIGPHPWDDCFTRLGSPAATLRWAGAATVRLETGCACVVAFDAPAHAICVEPQTAPPDSLNLGPTVVQPGGPLVATAVWRWTRE